MDEKTSYILGDKLIQLRKEKGLSQEQVAECLNVSRQAISKWESAQTLPSVDNLIQLSDLYGVSVDYIIRDNAISEDTNKTVVTTLDDTAVMAQLDEIKSMVKRQNDYEYISKTKVFGIPLVHIRFSSGYKVKVAKGIIAIGNVAFGVISIGAISVGLISFGAISIGLLLAIGALSLGILSLGGISFGALAIGGISIGLFGAGGVVAAKYVAIGGVTSGKLSIGNVASGDQVYDLSATSTQQIMDLVILKYPTLPKWLIKIVIAIANS